MRLVLCTPFWQDSFRGHLVIMENSRLGNKILEV